MGELSTIGALGTLKLQASPATGCTSRSQDGHLLRRAFAPHEHRSRRLPNALPGPVRRVDANCTAVETAGPRESRLHGRADSRTAIGRRPRTGVSFLGDSQICPWVE